MRSSEHKESTINVSQINQQDENSIVVNIASPTQSIAAQEESKRKVNTLFWFSVVGTASATLWMQTLEKSDNFVRVMGGGMFGAMPGAMPFGYFVASLCSLRARPVCSSTLFMLNGIPMSFLAGATVGLSEIAARNLGWSPQEAKYVGPIVTFSAVTITRIVAPVAIKKISAATKCCQNLYRLFKGVDASEAAPRTPLLSETKPSINSR